jgi:hypothetical protein
MSVEVFNLKLLHSVQDAIKLYNFCINELLILQLFSFMITHNQEFHLRSCLLNP